MRWESDTIPWPLYLGSSLYGLQEPSKTPVSHPDTGCPSRWWEYCEVERRNGVSCQNNGVQLKRYFVVNRFAGRWFKSKNVSGICQVPIFCAFFGHWLVGGGWWSNAGALQESPPTSRGQWALLLETRWYSQRMRRSSQKDGAALSDPQGRCSVPSWNDLFHSKKIRYRKYELQSTNSKVQEIAPIFAFCKLMWLQLWAYLRPYL